MLKPLAVLLALAAGCYGAGAVTITSPADGDHLTPGKVVEISWTNTTTMPSSVYVTKENRRIYLVQDYQADRGRVMWRVPSDEGAAYTITAEAANGVKGSCRVVIGGADASLPAVYATPNPFDTAVPGATLTFVGAPAGSTAKIYDMEGIEVRSLPADGLQWDGRNERGDAVAAGTYLFVVETPGGEKFNGKIAVVK